METFGRKLKQAVEVSGLRLEEVARATGLDVEHIEALERDDFRALPADDILSQGLQSFARLVKVDPDQVLADFRQERERSESPFEIDPEPRVPLSRRAVRVAIPGLVVLGVAAAVLMFWPPSPKAPVSSPPSTVAQAQTPVKEKAAGVPVTAGTRAAPRPDAPAKPTRSRPLVSSVGPSIGASSMSVPAHGVGEGIVDHNLVGETTHFAEGQRAWFWTRIEGAAAGETIYHVWILDGAEELRVPIRVGAARWRAHSYKALNPGSAGNWDVEARDEAGRVLARSQFSCSRPGGM